MMTWREFVPELDDIAFVRCALGSISTEGRKGLKSFAQWLLVMQNQPGAPVPESVRREIMCEAPGESQRDVFRGL